MTMESCCADRNRYILPVLWFMAGFSRAVPSVAMRILMVNELKVQPAQQAILGVAGGLPWSFKIFAAFLSDAVPVFGRRRVPYIVLSLLLQLTAYYILASDMPSVAALGALDFMQACGMVFIGTMADTLIVESMRRLDSGRTRFGALQANCWISMFIGGLLGNAISGHLHAATSTQTVFALTATFKVGMLLIPVTLDDPAGQKLACADRARFRQLRIEIVEGASDPRVWRPVLFLFIFSACPQNGDAWNSFLFGTPSAPPVVSNASRADASSANVSAGDTFDAGASNASDMSGGADGDVPLQPLELPEEVLGYISVVTTLSQAAGAALYRACLKRLRLRPLFAAIVCVSSLLQLTQLLLVLRVNTALGLPDVAFALGDDAIIEISRELLAMPMLVMMAALCPSGATGTVFALLTSVQMAGATLGGSLSAALTRATGVTLDDYSRLSTLTVACVALRLATLLALGLVPRQSMEQVAADAASRGSSGGGGAGRRFVQLAEETTTKPPDGDAPMPDAKSAAGDSSTSGGGGSQRQPRRRYLGAVLMLGLIASSLVWNVTAMLRSLAY